jgi:raffinose/stachyose/melibiose transport system substrate-binding protein
MRQSIKRSLAIVAVASVATLGLAACSSSSTTKASTVKSLTLWESQSTPKAVNAAVKAYKKASGVTINIVTVPDTFESNVATKWAAGQRPDLIFFDSAPGALSKLNPKKNLVDLGSLPFVTKTKFGLANAGELDGVHYTATYDFPSVFGVFYSKSVFAKAGISVPTSVAELNSDAAKLKADGDVPIQVTGGDVWTTQIGFLNAMTDPVKDGIVPKLDSGSVKYTSSTVTDAAAVSRSWVTKGWTNPDYATALYADVPKLLQAGKIGMYEMPSWMNPSFTGSTSNVGFFPYPSKSGAAQWQSSNNASVQVPKTGSAAKQAAAEQFVNYLTVGAGYKAINKALDDPSIIDGVPNPKALSPLNAAAAAAFAKGGIASFGQLVVYSPSNTPTLLDQVLTGQITPEQFGAQMQSGVEQLKQLQG